MEKFDVAIIGGGPGGYEAAIRCAQYGLRAALFEEDALGGTCLNRGCIPTKALLHGAELFEEMQGAKQYGIQCENLSFDYAKLAARKDRVVTRLRMGVEGLEKAHGVSVIAEHARLSGGLSVEAGGVVYEADNIILATGSQPALPPISGIIYALTSDDVLRMEICPDSFIIIGGGVIGVEFASLFSMLGKKVTIIEMLPDILSGFDAEIVQLLKAQGRRKPNHLAHVQLYRPAVAE